MAAPRTMDEFLKQNPIVYAHGIFQEHENRLHAMRRLAKILKRGILSNRLAKRARLGRLTKNMSDRNPDVYVRKVEPQENWVKTRRGLFHGNDGYAQLIVSPAAEKRTSLDGGLRWTIMNLRITPQHILAVVMPKQANSLHRAIDWLYLRRFRKFNKPIYSHEGKLIWAPK